MAARTGFDWSAFFLGIAAAVLVALAAGALIVFGGLFPIAASKPHSAPVSWLLGESRDHAVERSASVLKAPAFSPADIREGGAHFKGMCQECHGGPGAERGNFAAGMNPSPPDLAEAASDLSVQQVFWIAKNGIKMTGMPAFGKSDDDSELWKVAAFVKQIGKVSPTQYSAIASSSKKGAPGQKSSSAERNGR